MSPRITINMSADGELEIWLNEQGRDLLVRELRAMSEKSDHFHLATIDGAEIKLNDRAYRPTDKIMHSTKVYFRPDDWDRRHFPRVIDGET